jgi:hypothetical protein
MRRDECRAERVEKNMKRKISALALYAMLFAVCGPVDAQQQGKVFRRIPRFKHGFRHGGSLRGVPRRVE